MMRLEWVVLYALVGAVVWRILKGWRDEDFRLIAAAFWPATLVAWLAAGLLLVPVLLLAVIGYLNPWCFRARHEHPSRMAGA